MVGETEGLFKDSSGNHIEIIELQMQLWGDSDVKKYSRKEGPWKDFRKENVCECVQGENSRMFNWNNPNIQH